MRYQLDECMCVRAVYTTCAQAPTPAAYRLQRSTRPAPRLAPTLDSSPRLEIENLVAPGPAFARVGQGAGVLLLLLLRAGSTSCAALEVDAIDGAWGLGRKDKDARIIILSPVPPFFASRQLPAGMRCDCRLRRGESQRKQFSEEMIKYLLQSDRSK